MSPTYPNMLQAFTFTRTSLSIIPLKSADFALTILATDFDIAKDLAKVLRDK